MVNVSSKRRQSECEVTLLVVKLSVGQRRLCQSGVEAAIIEIFAATWW